jgi:hypothetical protein
MNREGWWRTFAPRSRRGWWDRSEGSGPGGDGVVVVVESESFGSVTVVVAVVDYGGLGERFELSLRESSFLAFLCYKVA